MTGSRVRFDTAARTAQWGTPRAGALAPDAGAVPWTAGDFAILNVEGLDRPFELDIVLWPDGKSGSAIVDAMIDRRRTLITRRPPFRADSVTAFAEGCQLEIMGEGTR
jgi:hypothetical protein